MELGRVDTFGEDVGKHLGVRDGVDHAIAVKDDPTEVMEPAEEMLSTLGGTALLREVFDGRAVDEVANRAHDIVARKRRSCRTYMARLAAKHAAAVSASAVEWQTTRMSCDW